MATLILLAAGRGSRLGSRTDTLPKCLNSYKDNTLIGHILDHQKNLTQALDKVVIVTGYQNQKMSELGHIQVWNANWMNTGPFESLTCAEEFLESESCIVSYTDLYYSIEFLKSCLDSSADIFVPNNIRFLDSWRNRQVSILEDLESFKTNGKYITEIGKKITDINLVEGQFSGLIKIEPKGWKILKRVASHITNVNLDMTSLLSNVIEFGYQVETNPVDAFWKEFDEPSDFENITRG